MLSDGHRMPPGKNMDDWFTMFKSGMWRLRYQLSAEGSQRFFREFLPLLHQTKAAALGADDDNSWYLVYIGTKPAARGKGYARALIEMVTKHVSPISIENMPSLILNNMDVQQADAEGLKCYLESSHISNFEYYRRRGFHPAPNVPKITLKRDASRLPIELDIMVRNPDPTKLEVHTAHSRDHERRDSSRLNLDLAN